MSKPFSERLRAFETHVLNNLDKIKCPVHLSLGSEDLYQSISENVRPEDWLFCSHRSHGGYLAKGGSEDRLWDEICGLPTGINQGYAGSQCFSDPSINFHSSSIVGGSVGIAVGTALALRGSGNIVISCFGDGATEEGIFWESINFAALKNLPILFICENNGLSINVPIEERQSVGLSDRVGRFKSPSMHLFNRVTSFGISGMQVSGNTGFNLPRRNEPYFVEFICEREKEHCYFPKQ